MLLVHALSLLNRRLAGAQRNPVGFGLCSLAKVQVKIAVSTRHCRSLPDEAALGGGIGLLREP